MMNRRSVGCALVAVLTALAVPITAAVAGPPPDPPVTTVPGTVGLSAVTSITVSPSGELYLSVGNQGVPGLNCTIQRVAEDGTRTVVAGTGTCGFDSEGGSATSVRLASPGQIDVDTAGNLFIVDSGNCRVRKVTADGQLSTIAGGGTATGVGVLATTVNLCPFVPSQGLTDEPRGIAVGDNGDVYFGLTVSSVVRRIDATGFLRSFGGSTGYSVRSMHRDRAGNLYIAAQTRIVKMAPDGTTTVAAGSPLPGSGTFGYTGDFGLATDARIDTVGVAVDDDGNIFLSQLRGGDTARIRRVDSTTGIIKTIAGAQNDPLREDCDGRAASKVSFRAESLDITPIGDLLIESSSRVCRVAGAAMVIGQPLTADDQLTAAKGDADGETIDVGVNDSDPDGGPITFSLASQASYGTATCTPAGMCTYIPGPLATDYDSFRYTATDVEGKRSTSMVLITIVANRPPVAGADSLTVDQDDPDGVSVDVSANDSDPESGALSFAVAAQGTKGTASCTTAGVCTYVPGAGQSGSDSFSYTVSDPTAQSATGTVSVTITPAVVRPKVSLQNAADVVEGNSGTRQMTFRLFLDVPATGGESVRFSTSAGTATPGTDFTAVDRTVTFAAGDSEAFVAVDIIGDVIDEVDEQVPVSIGDPIGLTLNGSAGAGLILDDDEPAPAACTAGETITVTWPGVTLGRTPSPVSVRSASSSAVIPAGRWSVSLTSTDPGHAAGVHTDQTQERWRIQLMNGTRSIAWSASTPDLPTKVTTRTYAVGRVTVPAGTGVDSVNAVHHLSAKPTAQWGSTHSIQPERAVLTCLG